MKICKFYKTWFFWFFMPIIIGIILPALNVWRVDVSLQWKHPFHPDGWYFGYNERRQKTNYLAEHATQKIDTIFLGTSRTTYINPEITGSKNGFNYAVSSGNYKDYEKYLKFAQDCSSESIDNIWLELSYFQVLDTQNKELDNPDDCIYAAQNFSDKFNTMFSHDAIKISNNAVIPIDSNDERISSSYLMRDNAIMSYKIRNKQYLTNSEKIKEVARQIKTYEDLGFYLRPYDAQCISRLKSLANFCEGKKVFVYMPPVGKEYMAQEARYGQLANHERFVREAVEVFGEVWDFAYPNEITMNDANFQDAHHATIETLNSMVHIILNREKEDMNRYMVNRENLENHILMIHDKYREIL